MCPIRFRGLEALAVLLTPLAEQDGVRVEEVAWTVTEATRRAVAAELRAVRRSRSAIRSRAGPPPTGPTTSLP